MVAAVLGLVTSLASPVAFAADVVKANNTTALNATGSWVGSVVPTSADVAVWNSTVTAARSSTIGGNISFGGIRIANPGGLATIAATSGSSLTLGASGIAMTNATQDLTINAVLNLGAAQTWSITNGRTLTVSGANTGSAAITISGPGNLRLGNANAFGLGAVTLGGAVNVGSSATTGRILTNAVTLNGNIIIYNQSTAVESPTITLKGGLTVGGTNTVTLTSSGSTAGSAFVSALGIGGAVTGSGTLYVTNGSSASNPTESLYLSSGASVGVGLELASGVSAFANTNNILTTSTRLQVDAGGTLELAEVNTTSTYKSLTYNQMVGSLTGAGTVISHATAGAAGMLTVDSSVTGVDSTFSGVITNISTAQVALTKAGANTLTLSGTNGYTGVTTVNGGMLVVNGVIGTNTVTVASGAKLGGTGTVSGATIVNGGLAPGGVGSIGQLNISNNVTWNGGSTPSSATDWAYTLGAGGTADKLHIVGNFTKGTGSAFRFDLGSNTQTGTFTLVDWTGTSAFVATNFSYTNLGAGLTGNFAIVTGTPNRLQLTVANSGVSVTNTVQYQIAASADDTWCAAGAGNSIYNDTLIYTPYSSTGVAAFLRWVLTVPPGATILSADLQLKASFTDVSGSSGTVQIAVVSSNSCPDFATYNPFSFGTLAGTTNWTIPSTWTVNTWYSSGTNSLTALVQAFINQGGYTNGNYMGLGLTYVSGTSKQAKTWDSGSTNGAILTVTYVSSSTNPPPAAPTAGNNGPVCAGSTLNLTASTVTNATYAWTGPNGFTSAVQNPMIANATTAASGTYSVTATVGGQTSSPGTTAATVNATPSAPTAGNSGPVCAGSTLNLTASTVTNATYSWTGPNSFTSAVQNPTIANATTAASGTYYVTVTVNGCASSAGTTAATVNAIPSAPTAGNNGPVCEGSTLNLTASTVTNATYSWTGPNSFTSAAQNPSIANATAAASGTYYVTVTVNGCTSTAGSTTATVNAIPSAPTAGNNGPITSGATLNLTASTVTNATYSWTGPNSFTSAAQSPTITNATTAASGTYYVTVTMNGCASSAGSTIATVNVGSVTNTVQYQIAASADDTWCIAGGPGNSIYLDTLIYTPYSSTGVAAFLRWALTVPPGATILSADLQLKASFTDVSGSSGTVQIAVVSSNSCPDFATYNPFSFGTLAGTTNWTIPSTWTVNTWYSSGTNSLTALVQAFINQGGYASGNYMGLALTYVSGTSKQAKTWDSGATNGAILTVTYVSSSTNTPPPAPTAGNSGPVCSGNNLNLTATTVAGATYSWTGPNGFASSVQNPTITNATPAASGTYSVTATVGGLTSSPGTTTATVNATPSAPTAGNNGPITNGATLNLTATTVAGATYAWTGPNGFTSAVQNPTITNAPTAASGTYYVTATVGGCASAAGSTTATVNGSGGGGGGGATNMVTMVVVDSGGNAASSAGAGNAGAGSGTIYWPYTDNSRLGYMRWQSQIPPGATITAAYLKVQSAGGVGNVDKSVVKVQVMDTNNCPVFSSSGYNPFGAAMMSGYVNWTNYVSFVPPTGWTNGAWYTSPDLSSLIQAYINRSDYSFGNYIGIGGSSGGGTWKTINTWDADAVNHSGAPQLVVYYTGGQTMLSLWMADPEVRLAQKVYCQLGNTYGTDTLQVKLDGNVIYTKAAPLSSTQEVFTANYRSLAAGAHTLQVNVLQTNGAVRTTASRTWTKLHAGIAKSAIDENNAICLNGTPIFPITPWGIDAGQFAGWSPYVNVQCGETFATDKNLPNWITYLNQSAAANQLVMGPLTGGTYYPAGNAFRTIQMVDQSGSTNYAGFTMLDTNRLAGYIAATKDYPSLFIWGWQDEPDLGGGYFAMKATEVRRWTDLGHAMDTRHPHYVSFVGYPFGNATKAYNVAQQQSYCFLYDDQFSVFWAGVPVLPQNSALAFDYVTSQYETYIFDANTNLVLYTNQSVPMVTNLPFAQKTPICDIMGFDYYPYQMDTVPGYEGIGLADLASALDNCRNWNYNLLPTSTWIETCAVGPVNGITNAVPTPVQLKNLIWLSVIHGVKCIQWFHYFGVTPPANYVEMNNALKLITALTQPILSAPENVTNAISGQGPAGGRVDLMSRQYNGQLYIFATTIPTNTYVPVTIQLNGTNYSAVSGTSTNGMGTSVTIAMSGLAAGQQIGVLGEGRTITSAAGSFTDTFSPLAVHIYTYPALTNIPPVANAGGDQQVAVGTPSGSASVTLIGTNSFDADGTITGYVWKDGATQIATGGTATVNLAAGTHSISLIVTDNYGATGTNTVTVLMTPPPVANAGTNQQVTDTNNVGSVVVTLNGSASYATMSTITNYAWSEGGNLLTNGMTPQLDLIVGTHDIMLTVTDNYGATGSAGVQVVVINTNVVEVQYQIAASVDDTWCAAGAGNSIYADTIIYTPYSSTGVTSFLRWPLTIPAGATILSANVQVMSTGTAGDSNPSTVSLQVVDSDNCPDFSINPFSYVVMTNNVNWTLPGTWTAGSWYQSGDIYQLVQSFINRPGYTNGSYLGLRVANVSGLSKQAYQWDYGTHTNGAILRVIYK